MLNMTKAEWDKQNVEQAEIPLILERELKVTISNDEAKKFYDEHGASFETPEMVRAAHILVMTRDANTGAELSEELKASKKKTAEDILKRARAGEDFGKLAAAYSDDSSTKDKGGELTVARGQLPNAKDFEDAAFSLKTNQVSDLVSSPFGYHVIKVYEKMPAKKEPFAGPTTKTAMVKQDGENVTIKEYLSAQIIQKQLPEYLKKLWKDASVEILDVRLKIDDSGDMPAVPSSSTNRPAAPGGR
jgi:parvulin-like peptidyl-prolyl isomerase